MAWWDFLQDQRGPRTQNTTLSDRSLSLRAAGALKVSKAEAEARQLERWRVEKASRKAEQERVAKEKADQEKESLFSMVPSNSIDVSENEAEEENLTNIDTENEEDSDSDWEDIIEYKDNSNYNTLKNFSRECDRYKTSNREGAKLANALMTKHNFSKLICPVMPPLIDTCHTF